MQNTTRLVSSALAVALAAAEFGPGGSSFDGAGRPAIEDNSASSSGSSQQKCLAAAAISTALGIEVREFPQGTRTYGSNAICAYQGTDAMLGAFVTTIVAPAAQSDEVFRKMSEAVKLHDGANAAPETIQVGERGQAYGSMSKSEAAAVSRGRLYHAEVVSTASANLGDKKTGLVDILKKLIGQ